MKYIHPRLSVSLLAMIAVIGSGCNQSNTTRFDGGFDDATITVTPTAFSFTNTAVGVDSTGAKFTLSNIGFESTGPVSHILDGPHAGEFVITASTCGQPLGFQASCEVTVVFRPVSAGSKTARLTVAATPGKSFSVIINATSQAPSSVRLQPTVFDFPVTPIPSPTGPPPTSPVGGFTVTNSGGTPVSGLTAEITGDNASEFAIADDACAGAVLLPQATCAISVRFKPTTSGPKSATLSITGSGGVKLPPATLSGSGTEPAKLTVTPTAQNFGTVPLGMRSAYSFDVTNTGGIKSGKLVFVLEGMNFGEFSATSDATCAEGLEPEDSCGITVTFAPTVPGTKTGSLRVSASPGGFVKAELTGSAVSVSSQGMITLTSPAPDPFGTVPVGESSSGFFVVENKGTAAAGKVMPFISGSNSTEFVVTDNGCPDRLEVGGVCGVNVRFSPNVSGRRTANLQVNALPGGFATLPMSGNATAPPQLTISPTTRSFGNRNVGSTTGTVNEFTIRILGSNAMTGPLNVLVEGPDAGNFQLVYNECQNIMLQPGRTSCRVGVRFVPISNGQKTASLAATASPGGVIRSTLFGNGT